MAPSRLNRPIRGLAIAATLPLVALPAQQTGSAADRIERRLWPAVTLAGTPDSGWSLRERMQHHGVAGLSVAVIRDGTLAWARGYGWRDRDQKLPVLPTTPFQAGSLSKPVAATVALRLVAQGVVTLDDDVNRWLRTWRVAEDSLTRKQPVTLRLLLSHRAGTSVSGFDGYGQGAALPSLVQVLRGEAPANSAPVVVERAPGGRSQYSGGGYVIVQQLLQETTGQTFESIAQRELFAPLGLTRTTYATPADAPGDNTRARGYLRDGKQVPGGWKVLTEQAPASLWSTPSEYAQIVMALQRAAKHETNAILPASLATAMMTLEGAPEDQTGLGVGLKGNPPFRFSHSGWNDGFRSLMIGYLDRGDGIVLMTNADHGDVLLMEVARAAAREYGWEDMKPSIRTSVALSSEDRQAMVGRYRLGENWIIEIAQLEGRLVAGPSGRQLLPLLSESRTEHFFEFADDVGLTTKWQGTDVTGIIWRQGTRRVEGTRIR